MIGTGEAASVTYVARDLWKHKDLHDHVTGNDVLTFDDVGVHDCVLLVFTPNGFHMEP